VTPMVAMRRLITRRSLRIGPPVLSAQMGLVGHRLPSCRTLLVLLARADQRAVAGGDVAILGDPHAPPPGMGKVPS
jgi:hypothetical protein